MKGRPLKLDTIRSLVDIHKFIQHGHTGGLHDFANKLNITPQTLNRRLKQMAELGAIIEYDRIRCTYVYDNHFDIKWEITFDKNIGKDKAS